MERKKDTRSRKKQFGFRTGLCPAVADRRGFDFAPRQAPLVFFRYTFPRQSRAHGGLALRSVIDHTRSHPDCIGKRCGQARPSARSCQEERVGGCRPRRRLACSCHEEFPVILTVHQGKGLLSGMGTGVIRGLQHLAEPSELPAATRTRLAQIHDDFDRHRDRIHDDRYLAAGYPIASGAIEGACRHGVKDRMERAGMHWTLPGAQALLNLRCVALNDEWEPFMNHHIQSETARLYANIPIQPPSARLRLVA